MSGKRMLKEKALKITHRCFFLFFYFLRGRGYHVWGALDSAKNHKRQRRNGCNSAHFKYSKQLAILFRQKHSSVSGKLVKELSWDIFMFSKMRLS